jgi:two-component system LytT family response regulator
MEISCIVIDDELPAINQMEEYISRVPFLKRLGSFNNAIEPMGFLKENPVDVIFLDIEMEDFTGLQFINSLKVKPHIILTTAYDRYAVDAFSLSVTDYLLKPISFERFMQAIDKLHEIFAPQKTITTAEEYKKDYAFFKTEYRLQRIDFKDILFVEGMKEYLRIHTVDERVMTLMTFSEILNTLPTEKFIRVHKSFIVSIDKIDSIERSRIVIGEEYIPISDTYKDAFFEAIN